MAHAFPQLNGLLASRLSFTVLLLLASSEALPGGVTVPGIDLGVRSSVDERWHGIHKDGAIEHAKVSAIIAIKEAPSELKLVPPAAETQLVQLLRTELNKRGFVGVTAPSQKPDVVLTVLYGRGYLRNPYLKGAALDEVSDILPVATIVLPHQSLREREAGYEAKIQAAQQEKHFIRVTAWKYPGTKGEKPAGQWKATMLVDDPTHRDLNSVAKDMLAAGAGYFDPADHGGRSADQPRGAPGQGHHRPVQGPGNESTGKIQRKVRGSPACIRAGYCNHLSRFSAAIRLSLTAVDSAESSLARAAAVTRNGVCDANASWRAGTLASR